MSLRVLRLAVCLFSDVAASNFQGPVELFGFLTLFRLQNTSYIDLGIPDYALDITYLSPTDGPVKPMAGPLMLASTTYDSVGYDEQYDILLIPGGYGARPNIVPPSLINFLKRQAPAAKYVLAVCTGSWILAQAGLLRGKRATTSKSSFNAVKESTKDQGVKWVAGAHWVVDGNYWTSSGIFAGADMANAFLVHLVGDEVTCKIRGAAELSSRKEDSDESAAEYELV